MATIKGLNAQDRPPERTNIKTAEVDLDTDIIDLQKLDVDNLPTGFAISGFLGSKNLCSAFDEFIGPSCSANHGGRLIEDVPVFIHKEVSGLRIIPSLFPPTVQDKLLTLMLHRDLSTPEHQTNLHPHYNIKYPDHLTANNKANGGSFFEADPTSTISPKDPHVHKPITIQGMLDKQLRWVTLGLQLCSQQKPLIFCELHSRIHKPKQE